MEIKFLGTGSSGNCIAIETGSTTILIDCGIPKTKIGELLIQNGINPGDICGIFITHSHGDHIKGLPLADKWNIPVYASEGTWKSIKFDGIKLHMNEPKIISPYAYVDFFRTHHNDYDSFGYTVNSEDFKISVCLDTGHIDADMIEAMSDSTHIIIEANHDRDKVALSDYPESVKTRNLSDLGHLANEQTADALCKLIQGKGECIYLAHLSKSCNTPSLAKMTVVNALKRKGFEFGKHYKLGVV